MIILTWILSVWNKLWVLKMISARTRAAAFRYVYIFKVSHTCDSFQAIRTMNLIFNILFCLNIFKPLVRTFILIIIFPWNYFENFIMYNIVHIHYSPLLSVFTWNVFNVWGFRLWCLLCIYGNCHNDNK